MQSKISETVSFDIVRYAQCWEDADVLLDALEINNDDVVLSIASAGDNSFAMLAYDPQFIYAIDLNFSQIACCELRKAMYKYLSHDEFLCFGGVINAECDRIDLFKKLKPHLRKDILEYWENNIEAIQKGFMSCGKFEDYFAKFRTMLLPLIHNQDDINALVKAKTEQERIDFYYNKWSNFRWNFMFRLFFSKFVMGRLGRDKEFFKFVDGSVSDRILSRAKHALTSLDTSKNPYLHWILFGSFNKDVLPFALRKENYEAIRANIDKIQFCNQSVEEFITESKVKFSKYNLSDIFEYMSNEDMDQLYEFLLKNSFGDTSLAYWNMLAPRCCSDKLKIEYGVRSDEKLNRRLLMQDKAFFYSKFYVDKVMI